MTLTDEGKFLMKETPPNKSGRNDGIRKSSSCNTEITDSGTDHQRINPPISVIALLKARQANTDASV